MGPVGGVLDGTEPRRGVIPLAQDVDRLYVFDMATFGGRGRSLGAPDPRSERDGAERPDDHSNDQLEAGSRTDAELVFGGGRTSGLRSALTIHSNAFGLAKRRSLASLLFADRVVVERGAALTLSRVPGRAVGVLLMVASVSLVAVPGLMAVEMSRDSAGTVRLIVALLIALASLVGLIECLRRTLLAWRWRSLPGPLFEVADLCAWPAGNRRGRRLLGHVCEAANEASVGLVLRVRSTNALAAEVYRGAGFEVVNDVDASRMARMIRPVRSVRASGPTRSSRPLSAFCAFLIAALAIGNWTLDRDLLGAICLLAGLSSLAYAAFVDARELRLPNFWTGLALTCGIAGSLVSSSWSAASLGAAVAAMPFLLMHLLDPKALGFGDVKFAVAAGTVIAIVWWPAAAALAVVAFTTSLALRLLGSQGPRAFGPSLLVGTLTAVFAAVTFSKGIVI